MPKATSQQHIVLYADDDPDDVLLVREALENFDTGLKVVTRQDGQAALEYLLNLSPGATAPCLIILDINMPRLNGKEALIQIRQLERFATVPIILFSTSSLPQDREFAHRYRAGFMTKPLDVRQMAVIAARFVDHCTEEVKMKLKKEA